MRAAPVLGFVALALTAGCSSGGGDQRTSADSTAAEVATTTTAPMPSSVPSPSSSVVEAGAVESITPYSVSIDVSVDSVGVNAELGVAIEPGGLDATDPFTLFSSCSGLRASVGTYVVTAVDVESESEVRAVTVLSTDRVDAPGVHEADVRVEFDEREPITAVGTMTLDDDLRAGSFVAFDAAGGAVEGAFRCDGPEGVAIPIDDADAVDGVLSAVEVVALMRRDDAERVVGLSLDTSEVTVADARCPGVTGSDEAVLVSVAGGPSVGSIVEFELTPDPDATMRMRVGGATYVLEDAIVTPDPTGAAGTFQGTTVDGVMVDGAFRCS